MSHPQLSRAIARAGCEYISSARLLDELDLDIPIGLQELVADAGSPLLRETYRDVAARPLTRMDLFRRGLATLPTVERVDTLELVEFVGLAAPGTPCAVDLDLDTWRRAQDGSLTGAELIRALGDDHIAALQLLLDAGQMHPAIAGGIHNSTADACEALNKVLAAGRADCDRWRAVPKIGTAVTERADDDFSQVSA